MLLRLAAGTLLAFVAVSAVGSLTIGSALRRVEERGVADRLERARHLLLRESEARAATVREYGWWTDTWDFIDAPHTPQAARFVRDNFLGWLPSHYGDRFIGIWSRDRRRAFVWTDSASRGVESVFERPERFALIDSLKSAGGLVATPAGLYLAAVSIVVHTDDPEATGLRNGYLVLARPVTEALLEEWSAGLRERLALEAVTADAARSGDATVTRRIAGGDSIETRFHVRGLLGEPVAVATLTASRAFVAGLRLWILTVIGSAAAVGLGVSALLWLVGLRTLVRPLESMAQALGRMRADGRLSALGAPAKAREWSAFVSGLQRDGRGPQCIGEALSHALPAGRRRAVRASGGRPHDRGRQSRRGACLRLRARRADRPTAERVPRRACGRGQPSGHDHVAAEGRIDRPR